MRSIITLFILFSSTCLFGQNQSFDTLRFGDALDSNLIEAEIEGYYGKSPYQLIDGTGFYYGPCITLTLRNIGDSSIVVHMPAGALLQCLDTTVQDMIVTKSFDLNLYPKSTQGYLIYAMCGEISDAGPSRGVFYDYGGLAAPGVVQIAELIENKNIQNQLGQFTMWAVRNDADTTKLIHYGAAQADLQQVSDFIYEAGLTAQLTAQIPPSLLTVETEETTLEAAAEAEPDADFHINSLTWIFMGISAGLFILLIWVSFKNKEQPLS